MLPLLHDFAHWTSVRTQSRSPYMLLTEQLKMHLTQRL
nr:MAG TPA: hypothetical protein [Caudoviricetes sp.]